MNSLVQTLTDGQTPRVWSLLVTVFGDLAPDENARISGALLSRITEAIGIKPQSNRVALHRLRKEGWIVSFRTGRQSEYALTDWGRSQTALATPRIYATDAPAQNAWLIVTPPSFPFEGATGHPVGSGLFLAPQPVDDGDVFNNLITPDTTIPHWMRERVCSEAALTLCADIKARFLALEASLADPHNFTPLQIAVLRVLIVHAWRRVVLRSPVLPDYVFPPDWAGPECRALAGTLLRQLPVPVLAVLEQAALTPKAGNGQAVQFL